MAPKKRTQAKKSAPKKSVRMVAKVSPLKGTTVEDYIRVKATGWQADAIKSIVALVKREAPLAQGVIKWSQPIFEHNGPFAWVKPAARHVTFGFWRGAELADPGGVLEGEGNRMRHLKLKSATEVEAPHVVAFVREAFRLNQLKGDPTKR